MPQRVGELLVAHRVRGNHIKRPPQVVIQQPEDTVDHVVDMDPRQILPSATDRAAEAKFKSWRHFGQNAAARRQHHAGTQQADAGAIALRFTGDLLPAGAKLMGKLVMRRLFFGNHDFTEVAIVTGGGTAYQHRGRRIAGVEELDQLLRDIPAAVAETLFLLRRPALIGDRLTGQINDGINAVEVRLMLEIAPQGDARIEAAFGLSGLRVETVM